MASLRSVSATALASVLFPMACSLAQAAKVTSLTPISLATAAIARPDECNSATASRLNSGL